MRLKSDIETKHRYLITLELKSTYRVRRGQLIWWRKWEM